MLNRIPLSQVADILNDWWQLGSSARLSGPRLTPDVVADSAREAAIQVEVEPIASWEHRTDLDLLHELSERAGPFAGDLILVTEASFDRGLGAFRLDASEFPATLLEHQTQFEPVFNGDVLLLTLEDRRVVCVHHENYLIKIAPADTSAE